MYSNGDMGICYTDCKHSCVRNSCEAAFHLLIHARVTYPVDCYENQAGEVSLLINLARNIFSFNVSFYIRPFTEKVGYAWAYGIWAIVAVVLFLPVIGLMIWGGRWRQRFGAPQWEHA
jgi:hypothetical protein